jgi:hypothetical protein
MCIKTLETLSLRFPELPFPEVLKTTSSWPGQTLGKLLNPACQMCTCQHTTCSDRKPIFYCISSSLGKYAGFWHLSPLILLHTLRQKSHFVSQAIFPSFFEKLFEFSLNRHVGYFVFLLFMYLRQLFLLV